jgi:nicotinate-nucleotide adenylyltransferase
MRVRLLRLALAGQTGSEVDEQELGRGGLSYTIDTVRDYARRFPDAELHYLVGADHVPLLPEWRQAAELAQLTRFAVIPRPGQAERPFPPGFRGQWLGGFAVGISSSEIRARVRAGLPLTPLVPEAVAEAIRNNGLYL